MSAHSDAASSNKLVQSEADLCATIGTFAYDPLSYVLFAYPWGRPGTRLADEAGPDEWQSRLLTDLGNALRSGSTAQDAAATAIRLAVSSGHGVGKTALVAWIINWFVSCFDYSQTVVTANTKSQLLTKTWRELAKWWRMSINKHWFTWTSTQFKHVHFPDTWFASAIPWSVDNSEAFAGTHETYVLVVYDEASAVEDPIWEVTEGAMTTPNAIWLAFGNPTRNTGAFHRCFNSQKHRWRTYQVDSRSAKKANKAQIQQWVEDYGEDSDFVRVRVRGVFPRAGSLQLISGEAVYNAMRRRDAGDQSYHARLMGIDIARHGDDQSAIIRRQGLTTSKCRRFRITDLMLLASVFAEEIVEYDPDAVFVDVTGMGWGVYDRLCMLVRPDILHPVQVGERATNPKRFFNKRTEIWWLMKEWVEGAGELELDNEMETDLTGPEYGFENDQVLQLEKKEDMKARDLASPDGGDALAMTFAAPVLPRRREAPRDKSIADRLRRLPSGSTTSQSS